MGDLLGGTTGQVLSKNSNTNMDFTWITNDVGDITAVTAGTGISGGGTSGAVTITNSMATEIAAKGDLIVGTGSQTFDNLTVGANDLLLTAASGEATGLKYTGAWTDYTPTFTNFTKGNGTVVARYRKVGKNAEVFIRATLGSTSSVGGFIYFTLPSGIIPNYVNIAHSANCAIEDSGTAVYAAYCTYYGTGEAYLFTALANSTNVSYTATGTTNPMTWTTNDSFQVQLSYEVA
jgi:hypothetical protein